WFYGFCELSVQGSCEILGSFARSNIKRCGENLVVQITQQFNRPLSVFLQRPHRQLGRFDWFGFGHYRADLLLQVSLRVPDASRFTGQGSREGPRSEEHTSELQSRFDLVCRLLL